MTLFLQSILQHSPIYKNELLQDNGKAYTDKHCGKLFIHLKTDGHNRISKIDFYSFLIIYCSVRNSDMVDITIWHLVWTKGLQYSCKFSG